MIHDRLFPTNIFIKENFIKNYKDVENAVRRDYNSNVPYWQSTPDLYKRNEYQDFTKSVLNFTAEILDKLKYNYDGFRITDMWSNVLIPGETHKPHTHANNLLSGVYYPYAEKTSGIVFMDPRPQASVIKPTMKEILTDTCDVYEYNSNTNKIIVFPSWLQHFVPINNSKTDRVSIAWNIQITGKVGRSKDFQSAEFV